MPLYEYTCQICLNTFERLRPMSQMDDDANCPDCGGASKKQLSVFASFSTTMRIAPTVAAPPRSSSRCLRRFPRMGRAR